MLTPAQARIVLSFLERIQLAPREIQAFAEVAQALQTITNPPAKVAATPDAEA